MYKFILKTTVTLLFILLFLTIFKKNSLAALEAESTYEVNVEVNPDGFTWIKYDIKLKNKTSGFSIHEYSILSDHTDLTDISLKENGQSAYFRKEHFDDKVRMRVVLKQPLLKKGDSVNLLLRYRTDELNNTRGLVRSIYIPSIKTEEKLLNAEYLVKIPHEFGEINYISLSEKEIFKDSENKTLKYNHKQAPFGTLLLFGSKQQFEFTYNYQLNNDFEEDKNYTVSLPPNSYFQEVYIVDTDPQPDRVFVDHNGNTFAEYFVSKGEQKQVKIFGVTVYSKKTEKISLESFDPYLFETDIWNFQNDEVMQLINKITREDNLHYENAKVVYEYIVNNYSYKASEKTKRYKASEIISGTEGLNCQNVNDLYISLARGAGVPTREVVGYSSIFQDVDNLHYWSEVYSEHQSRWIGVDPCLGAIYKIYGFEELDINRAVLAYRSTKHDYPQVIVPFKKLQGEYFNLEINLSSYEYLKVEGDTTFSYQLSESDVFSKKIPITVSTTNNTKSVVRLKEVIINGKKAELANEHLFEDYQEAVFPGQTKSFKYWYETGELVAFRNLKKYKLDIKYSYGNVNEVDSFTFKLNPSFGIVQLGLWIASGIASLLIIGALLIVFKNIRNRKRKKGGKIRNSKKGDTMDVPISLS